MFLNVLEDNVGRLFLELIEGDLVLLFDLFVNFILLCRKFCIFRGVL